MALRGRLSEPLSELRRIKVRECGEPLVDILAYSRDLRWAEEHPVFQYTRVRWARQSVARMLAEAQALLPKGIHLEIVEGWRSIDVQRMMYSETLRDFRHKHPNWSDATLRRMTNRYSAPPDDPAPPPHLTGGAVDLNLIYDDGRPLDFTSPFALHDRQGAAMDADRLSLQARENRALLRSVLEPVGLTNYAAEWWHWSYGDQGWALRIGEPFALYDAVFPPDWSI